MVETHCEETIGIRELRMALSGHLRRVRDGAHLVITEHGRPIARLSPFKVDETPDERLRRRAEEGGIVWEGGKPCGSRLRAGLRGDSVSSAVVEDRR